MEIRKREKRKQHYQKAAVTGKKLEASKIENEREKGLVSTSKCTKAQENILLNIQCNLVNIIHYNTTMKPITTRGHFKNLKGRHSITQNTVKACHNF